MSSCNGATLVGRPGAHRSTNEVDVVHKRLVIGSTIVLASLLAACGSDDDGDETADTDAPSAETSAPSDTSVAGTEPPTSAAGGDPLSVVLLIGGPSNDGGFYQAMADGLADAAEADGAIDVTVIEQIAQGGDAALEDAVRNAAASEEYDLIVAHGFDLVPGVARYAPEFPDQAFATSLPVDGAENVAVYLSVFEEIGYNAGFLAAQATKGGGIGLIGGPGLEFELQAEAGFRQAVEEYAPGTEVTAVYTGTFEDPQLGLETARQMFDTGVDSVWNQLAAGQSGVYEACRAAGAPDGTVACFGNSVYSAGLGPDVVLASTVSDYEVLVPLWAERLRSGTWSAATDILNIANGGATVTPAEPIAAELFPELPSAIDEFLGRADEIVVEPAG